MSGYEGLITSLRFWDQIHGDAKRTVLCEPDHADEIRAAVQERGLGHIITVLASPHCPAGQLIVLDDAAIEASNRETLQRLRRSMYR